MKKFIATFVMLAVAAAATHAQTLTGEFPSDGGAITVTAAGGDVVAAGLDFNSASGGLVPAPGTDASPFTFFLKNTANQVTYGNLGSNVTFADGSSTALSVGATAGTTDIVAAWGNGATPVAFEVSAAGDVIIPPAGAAITWGSVNAATTLSDVVGLESSSITFQPLEYPGGNAAGTFFTGDGGDTGSPDLNALYDSHGWNGEGATLTLEGLTAGNNYVLQLFGAGDTRGCCATRTQAADDGLGNVSGDFLRGASSVVGSFTAAGTTQDFMVIAGSTDGVDPGLSGYILADEAGAVLAAFNIGAAEAGPTLNMIPEPASSSLAVLAGLGAMMSRRRKR